MTRQSANDFVAALAAELSGRAVENVALAPFLTAISAVTDGPDLSVRAACTVPTFRGNLTDALAAMPHAGPVTDNVMAIADRLGWYQVYQGEGIDPALAERMFAGQVVGQVGLLRDDRVRTGLFLLAPGLHYPLHTHAASEIYFCLSGSVTLQYGITGEPFDLEPGGISVTQSDHVHALTTGPRPTLLIYQWIGEIDSPNWWWAKRPDGRWWREKWTRQPDASWAAEGVEPVPEEQLSAMA